MSLLKSIWNAFGDAYDDMQNTPDNYDYEDHSDNSGNGGRVITTGWACHPRVVNGPIRIEHRENGGSVIRCYPPGQVYPGADVAEYTDARAIQAYWSGDVLYANLEDGRIVEWYNPGCPYAHY